MSTSPSPFHPNSGSIWLVALFMIGCGQFLGLADSPTAAVNQPKERLQAADLFDRQKLMKVEIEISEANWDQLRFQSRNFATALMKPAPPTPYSWVKANITVNGHAIPNVGIRKKGFIGSQDTERPSLKIKFDKYQDQQPIQGLSRLTLNNNKQDRSFASQSLTYKLFADADLPTSRSSLAQVWVNGVSLGIYTHVESVKKPMLERNFDSADGKLYEGTVMDFIEDRIDGFESKTNGETEDRTELMSVANLVADGETFQVAKLEQYVAVDEFIRFWAMESLIGFWDGYTNNQNNYFIYLNPANSKFHFLPWGADAAFSYDGGAKMFKRGPESVHGQAYLPNRLFRSAGIPNRYRKTLQDLLDTVWKEDELIAEIDYIEQLVQGHTHASQADFGEALEQTRSFIRSRRKRIQREFDRWPVRLQQATPKRPFYTAKVGTATGTFETKWSEEEPDDPYEFGTAELKLTIDGEVIEFSRLGVHSIRGRDPGMDGKRPPTVVFVGKRESNKIKVTFGIGTDQSNFDSPSGTPVPAMGAMVEGAWFLGRGFRMLGGTVTLDEAGVKPGDTVRGTLRVDVVQFKGNMR